jgi:predicted DNA-binding transcriptional regulator YafY
MRASRLVELLLHLQIHGGASATELARRFEVSVRTVYRDVEALASAGVPIYTETGRNGGVRIDPSYRVAGLPTLRSDEARGVLFAVVPMIAAQLGFDAAAADRTLLPAMDSKAEAAARVVHERLLVEPTHWFVPPVDTPMLTEVAKGVWESRELRLSYRGSPVVVQPLGLILKGDTWYLLADRRRDRADGPRLYRLSRIEEVEVLDHRFERPPGFDLGAEWARRQAAFFESLPEYVATVRVAPGAEQMLSWLDEAAPELPLPDDVKRDEHGWAVLQLRFERRLDGTARHLLRLGANVEVLDPPELRNRLADTSLQLAALYRM